MDFRNLNKFNAIDWNIKLIPKKDGSKEFEGFEYTKLEKLFNEGKKRFILRGCYITRKGNFGESANAIVDGYIITLPKHQVDTVKNIREDSDMVDAIKRGECIIEIVPYFSTQYQKEFFDIKFDNATQDDMAALESND